MRKNLTGSQRISLFLSILGLFAVGQVIDILYPCPVLLFLYGLCLRPAKKTITKYFTIMSSFQVLLSIDLGDALYNSTAKNNILSQKCFIQLCNFVWFANMHEQHVFVLPPRSHSQNMYEKQRCVRRNCKTCITTNVLLWPPTTSVSK